MTISTKDRKILWGKSANRCAICKTELVADATELDSHALLGDECHIVAQKTRGPRGEESPEEDVDSYSNLLILCRNHHKLVDDQPDSFPPEKLRQIKQDHERWVRDRIAAGEIASEGVPDAAAVVKEDEEPVDEYGFEKAGYLPAGQPSHRIFSWRLADAFPGQIGTTEINDPKAALDRLQVLFRNPLGQKHFDKGSTFVNYPLWWFRGGRNMYIQSFRRLSNEKCLMDEDELLIHRVVAHRRFTSPSMWDFLYVEVRPEPPVGAYPHDPEDVATLMKELSREFWYEEYAIWNGRTITRTEYDDGVALIDGRPTRVRGAELRVRYLTPYNFIVCGNQHVINENTHDRAIERLMDGILRGEKTVADLVAFVETLEKPFRYEVENDW